MENQVENAPKKPRKKMSPCRQRHLARYLARCLARRVEQATDVAETRAILVSRFPLAFMPKGAEKRPLKIGIAEDAAVALPEIDPAKIKAAIRDYAKGPTYLRNAVAGSLRLGLDGQPAGEVTERDAKYHAGKLSALDPLA